MKKEKRGSCFGAASWLLAFGLWTVAVCLVDVQPIGPMGSEVGFAELNRLVHGITGVHMGLYVLTDWLGLVPLGTAMGFALYGLTQWVRRRCLWKVDRDILALGCFYLAVAAVYAFFERVVINYRPILINGILEASYPSSTTLLVLCIMPTAGMQLRRRIKSPRASRWAGFLLTSFTLFVLIARLVSGVHWFSDIVGGVLVSTGLVRIYGSVSAGD